jgi:hypothetical protein
MQHLHVDGMIPKDAYLRIRAGKMITVALAYDPDIERSDVLFQTPPFETNDDNFEDYAKGNQQE